MDGQRPQSTSKWKTPGLPTGSHDLPARQHVPLTGLVDLVQIWKDSSKNYEHKAWNVGVLQWNQFADDDYANLSKPQMAEAKIWSTNGKGGMRYAIRKWTGSSWSTSNTNITTHAPTNLRV